MCHPLTPPVADLWPLGSTDLRLEHRRQVTILHLPTVFDPPWVGTFFCLGAVVSKSLWPRIDAVQLHRILQKFHRFFCLLSGQVMQRTGKTSLQCRSARVVSFENFFAETIMLGWEPQQGWQPCRPKRLDPRCGMHMGQPGQTGALSLRPSRGSLLPPAAWNIYCFLFISILSLSLLRLLSGSHKDQRKNAVLGMPVIVGLTPKHIPHAKGILFRIKLKTLQRKSVTPKGPYPIFAGPFGHL